MKRTKVVLIGLSAAVATASAIALPAWAGSDDDIGRAALPAPPPTAAPIGEIEPNQTLTPLSGREQARIKAELREFVDCMRERGIALPPPEIGPRVAAVDLGGPVGERFSEAARDCGMPAPPAP